MKDLFQKPPLRFLVVIALFTTVYLLGIGYLMDDAYISFVYSKNLLKTGQPLYNGVEVEGYSSFLHVIFGAILLLVSGPFFDIALKIAFYLAGIAVLVLAGHIVDRLSGSSLQKFVCQLVLATSPVFVYHCETAMETSFFIIILLSTVAIIAHNHAHPLSTWLHKVLILFFVGMLCRPDFAVFAIPFIVYALLTRNDNFILEIKRANWRIISGLVLLGMLYLGWKYMTYGDLLPNTFYVKKAIAPTSYRNLIFWQVHFAMYNPVIILLFAYLLFTVKKNWQWLLVALSCFAYTYAFLHTNFWQNQYDRYFSPLLPLATVGFFSLIPHSGRIHSRRYVLAAATIIIGGANVIIMPNYYLYCSSSAERFKIRKAIGTSLKNAFPKSSTIAVGDAGIIPFYSELRNVDFYFLNSKKLFQNRVEGTYWGLNTDLLFEEHPDVLILASSSATEFIPGHYGNRSLSYEIAKHEQFQEYSRVMAVDVSGHFDAFRVWKGSRNYPKKEKTYYYYHIMVHESKRELGEEFANAIMSDFPGIENPVFPP